MKIPRHILIRIGGATFLFLLVLGSISYIAPGNFSDGKEPVKGKYRLASVQDGELMYFEGPVYFEFADQQNGNKPTPVFKLHFINQDVSRGRGFGFQIPLTDYSGQIHTENFKVSAKRKGFINKFETVFGYADVVRGETTMFFTESGSISIRSSSRQEVAGDMNMLLKDAKGKSMRIRGSFNARPLRSEQAF